MEAAASRGAALPASSSQSSKREWRVVSEHSVLSNGSEEPEHVKLGQSSERTIYEKETGPPDADFCSITIDESEDLSDELLQQRLQDITRQREGLQQMEIELRAHSVAKFEVLEVQNSYGLQLKEHASTTSKLKEQLEERDKHIIELEKKLEEKDKELCTLKIDNEAAWAKEDLLREQNKELATFRRERGNVEAERAQNLKNIRDLQEHIQEKESQFIALEEQHRVAQETIIYKDEQLREVQAWIARVQEMDALQSSTNQSLHAELRERTEQFNQLYIGLQRQCAEIEHHHKQVIQQLQLELAEARERNGIYKDGSRVGHLPDSSSYIQTSGSQIHSNDGGMSNGNLGFTSDGIVDATSSYALASNQKTKSEQVHNVPIMQSSLLGMGVFLPPGQMTALHPYVMNPQGVAQSIAFTNTHIPRSHVGHFQPISIIPSHQHLQTPEADSYISKVESKYETSQTEQDLLTDANPGLGLSSESQITHHQLSAYNSQHMRSGPATSGLAEQAQVLKSNSNQKYALSNESQGTLNGIFQLKSSLAVDPAEEKIELQDADILAARNQSREEVLESEQQWTTSVGISSSDQELCVNSNGAVDFDENVVKSPEVPVLATLGSNALASGKSVELCLLDERSLLACIVRAIPAAGSNGGIRISTTLPNRLAKMLAPLHWHDYKKCYGKLDDFVSRRPELFVTEGDFIHLREGAQEIISATTAVAKVAAAATASPFTPSMTPSVAAKTAKSIASTEDTSLTLAGDSIDSCAQMSKRQDQLTNSVNFNMIKGLSDATISSKLKKIQEANNFSSETKNGYSPHLTPGNVVGKDKAGLSPVQSKGPSNERYNVRGKQQGRSSAGLISRK